MPRIFVLLLLLPLGTFAQRSVNLTLFGGFANYSGDLQEQRFTLNQSHAALGAGLSYQLTSKLLLRGSLSYGKISGDDKQSVRPLLRERNLNFFSSILEASALIDYSLSSLESRKLTPYVFAGIAAYRFNPYTFDSLGAKAYLKPLSTEGQGIAEYPDRKPYSLVQVSLPFGGGIRFRITENAYLGYEIGLRKVFTDYLDDVSTDYVNETILANNRGPRAVSLAFRADENKDAIRPYPVNGTTRGGPEFKDWYYFSGITLSIGISDRRLMQKKIFGKRDRRGSIACPPSVL